ncbi:hydroxycarboxylic acid receptor 1-like [Gadus morhua]|uniref:hydroxycarboxylic acid receptor 1-like n=1 Tax=Gadus morhua TaxID=8049 RepID=UPI0011B4BECE|nr:hydroxycarboxylic acid receptor 1-like [Gadus morhua]
MTSDPVAKYLLLEFSTLTWFGRPLFQCCIGVERYLAVIHPLTFIRFKPLRFRVVCSGLMWVAVTVILLSIGKVDEPEGIITISFFMTLSVIMFCCLSVLWSLKQPGPVETERTAGNIIKRRAFNIISLNLGNLLVTYLPTIVISSLKTILSLNIFFYLFISAMCLTVLGGIAQPLLHLQKAGKLPRWPNPVTYQDNANPEPPHSPLGPRGHRGPEKVPAPRNNRGDCVRSASARAEAEGAP